jgi:uncharacterized Zn finger protein
MASETYIATGMVRHGQAAEPQDKAKLTIFQPGDEIKGLDKEDLDELVARGYAERKSVLQRRNADDNTEPSEEEQALRKAIEERDQEIEALRAKLEQANAGKQVDTRTPSGQGGSDDPATKAGAQAQAQKSTGTTKK